jgi:hypothetical protein
MSRIDWKIQYTLLLQQPLMWKIMIASMLCLSFGLCYLNFALIRYTFEMQNQTQATLEKLKNTNFERLRINGQSF